MSSRKHAKRAKLRKDLDAELDSRNAATRFLVDHFPRPETQQRREIQRRAQYSGPAPCVVHGDDSGDDDAKSEPCPVASGDVIDYVHDLVAWMKRQGKSVPHKTMCATLRSMALTA